MTSDTSTSPREAFRVALREGRIFVQAPDSMQMERIQPRAFDCADYDLGKIPPEGMRTIRAGGEPCRDWIERGAPLPFDRLGLYYDMSSANDPEEAARALAVHIIRDGDCILFMLTVASDPADAWVTCPVFLRLDPAKPMEEVFTVSIDTDVAQQMAKRLGESAMQERLGEFTEEAWPMLVRTAEVAGAVLLQIIDRQVEVKMGRMTSTAHRTNAERAKRGLPPLPRVRTIDPTRIVYVSVQREQEAARRGGTKAPHDRAGHMWRNPRTGMQQWRRGAKIHGGSEAAPAYRVNIDADTRN